jgi:biotin carboxylase
MLILHFFVIIVNMKNILIVGKNFSNLKTKIFESGYDYILLQDIKSTKYPNSKFKNRIVVDYSDINNVINAVDNLTIKVDAVVNIYENYVVAASVIANRLGLPGMTIESAKACTDKYLMRQMFAKASFKISPDYAEVKSWDDAMDFANNHEYPIVLKPANLAKSLLVFKNDSLEELKCNYAKMTSSIEDVYKKYSPHNKPKIVIEEFMKGTIHSVDAFIDIHGTPHILEQVVDYQTGYEIGYDDNFHYSRILPSKLSRVELDEVRNVAKEGCIALGMKSSPAHIEIIITKEGPMIVEIGARNGGYRERMHMLANNIDILGNTIKLALNEPINIVATKNEPCAVLELFPRQKGTFKKISCESQLRKLSSLEYFAIKQPIGSLIGKSSDGYKMCAVIILHNKNYGQFEKDLKLINNSVTVIAEPL